MKITLTGSLGNISKPLAQTLINKGHEVTIISSNANRAAEIEALGATPAIGSIDDVDFLTSAFSAADAVYTMVPPSFTTTNYRTYIAGIGSKYAEAIKKSGVKKIVNLSSIGADLPAGTGPIAGLHDVENIYKDLDGVAIKHLRPAYFFINFFGNIDMIKHANILGSNYNADTKLVLVHPNDIAEAAAEELQHNFTGTSVRYIASNDEITAGDVASTLGKAVGKAELPWIEFTNEQALEGMVQAGLSEEIAKNYVEMGDAIRNKVLFEDYYKNRPAALGKTKLEDFASEFALVYNS